MLEKSHNQYDIVTLKLTSGEEVIGYFVSNHASGITLRKPVVPVPTADGTGMMLAPYLMSSDYLQTGDGELKFNNTTIITSTTTGTAFAQVYIQQVSGIDTSASDKPGLIL